MIAGPAGAIRRRERVGRAAPLIAGALVALPTLVAYYPPMTDLPGHEAVVGILRHWGDESWFPRGLYTLNLGHSNQLFHLVAWLLSYAVGTRWAVKIVIALAQIAIFHAGARFADHTGRSRWAALLLAPLALGFTFYWGFVANLLGYAGLLYALPLFDRSAAEPTPRRAGLCCLALALLFWAHGSVFVMAMAIAFFLVLLHPVPFRDRLVSVSPLGFGFVLGAAMWWRASLLPPAGTPQYKTYFFPLARKLETLPESFVGTDDSGVHAAVIGIAVVSAVALLAARFRARPVARLEEPDGRPAPRSLVGRVLLRHRFELMALAIFVAWLAAPYHYQGAMFVHHRFIGPAWALFALTTAPVAAWVSDGSVVTRATSLVARVGCALLPVVVTLAAIPQFRDADGAHRDLAAMFDRIPMKGAVTFVSIDRGGASRGRAFDVSPAVARVVAERGGRAGPTFTTSSICPVRIPPEHQWDEYTYRLMSAGSRSLVPSHDLERFGWVVARTRSPQLADHIVEAFQPHAELTARQGEWLLFRSLRPVASLTSSDAPAPKDLPNIMTRVVEVEQSRRSQQH